MSAGWGLLLLERTPSEDLIKNIRSFNRRDARLVVKILTDQGALNYHMNKMDRTDTTECMTCEEEETSILCNCPA